MEKSLYFISIIPPKDVYNVIRSHQKVMADKFGSHKSFSHIPHLTLVPPFHIDSKKEVDLKETLNKIHFEDFKIELKDFSHFKKHTIFSEVKLSDELFELHTNLLKRINSTEDLLLKKINYFQKYRPHITVGYRDLEPNFKPAWNFFQNQKIDEEFMCNSFSLLKHNGGKWEIIDV